MKKLAIAFTIAVAGLLATPAIVSAQDQNQRRTPRSPEEQIKALKESLKLSDEQTEKLKPVFAKVQEKQKALRDDEKLSQEDRRSKMRELNEGLEAELKPILTPEQLAKWKEDRAKRRAQRQGGGTQ